jgi:hypothetical protein
MDTQTRIVADLVRDLSDEALCVLADLAFLAVEAATLHDVAQDQATHDEIAAMVEAIPTEGEG